MKRLIILPLFLGVLSVASDYNAWLKEQQNSYFEYKKSHDEAFLDSLKKDWEAFQSMYDTSSYEQPKPKQLPQIQKATTLPKELIDNSKPVSIKPPVVKQAPLIEKKEPLIPAKTTKKEKEPIIEKKKEPIKAALPFGYKEAKFDFYAHNISINYNQDMAFLITQVNKNAIANYYERLSKINSDDLIKQINSYTQRLNLNDWAQYLLIYNLGQTIYKTDNMANLFTWYVLTKLNYDVKVGYSSNDIYLLSTIQHQLFQVAFFTLDSKKYYVLSPKGRVGKIDSMYTYKNNHAQANNSLSFEFTKPLQLHFNIKSKALSFNFENEKQTLQTKYSLDLVEFYKTFPQSDYAIYLNEQNSQEILQSLQDQLLTMLEGKTEVQAVNMLLRFVQTAFEYKTDEEQFSHEKVLFPQETLFYPYSDCEDRTILFTLLVKNLLNLKTVAIKYDDHLSAAVEFSTPINANGFTHQNRQYIFADPTYINANIGMVMPKYQSSSFRVIK
jgi:hypothetical protein